MKHIAGIVLAGGRSRRMGADKATLPFGAETLLQRVARIVGQATSPVVVVAAQAQSLPELPRDIVVVRDQNPDRGPLEGMAAGLRAVQELSPEIAAAYITACDTPLLLPGFADRMAQMLDESHDAAVPMLDDVPQPLSGVYRTKLLPQIDELLAANRLRVRDLLERVPLRLVQADQLRDIDPGLLSLRNVNTPDDFRAALAAAGLAKDN
jgi:molybdenum cofactor guanylyltransferase